MSHHLVGVVELDAVVNLIARLARMAQEKGLYTATHYAKCLPSHILSQLTRGKRSVSESLSLVVEDIEKKAVVHGDKRQKERLSARKQPTAPKEPGGRVKKAVKDKLSGNELICLKEDPANKMYCPDRKSGSCRFLHLDTNKSECRIRFDKVKKLVESKKAKKQPEVAKEGE